MPRKNSRTGQGFGPWDKNPEILARVKRVEEMTKAGMTKFQIADELGIDQLTVTRDRARVLELYKTDIKALREIRILELEDVKEAAWTAFASTDTRSMNKPQYLRQVESAVMNQAKLAGLDKVQVEVEVKSFRDLVERIQQERERAASTEG